ncbi:MAG TPA: hypothetical protein VGL42_08900 [Opitutaceae bacterium]|jgi:general secretion pathway protein K
MRRRLIGRNRGTVLIIVIVMLMFTAAALTTFLDRASNDLLVAEHVKVSNRLREDAYSALEVTLGVLMDFQQAQGGTLRAPSEGWGDPLAWAGWSPPSGHKVDVAFVDESGKLPLIQTNATTMLTLFEAWGLSQNDAQHLTDVLRVWIHNDYLPQVAPTPDYEESAVPYDQPLRSLRSYDELAAIDYAKDIFYDANGRKTDLWWRFYNDFSLFNYPTPNVNAANQDLLAGVGQFDPEQQKAITDFLADKGDFVTPNPMGAQWFTSGSDLKRVVGAVGNPAPFGASIAALQINITVHEKKSIYRLSVIVSPSQGGARTVNTTATAAHQSVANAANGENATANPLGPSGPNNTATNAQTSAAAAGTVNIQFPFTILEIEENDQILTPPTLPPLQITGSYVSPTDAPSSAPSSASSSSSSAHP